MKKQSSLSKQSRFCWQQGWLLVALAFPNQGQSLTVDESKRFIREVFSKVIEDINPEESVYRTYFSKELVQLVDGKKFNFDDFVAHMHAQKRVLKRLNVSFREMVVEKDKVATIHLVEAEKKDGSRLKAQVNAIFEIKNGKITLCDELTHLLVGSEEDKDLGSRK